MEENLTHSNITFRFSDVMLITAIFSLIILIGLKIAATQDVTFGSELKNQTIPNVQPSSYGVVQLFITLKNTGTGLINLDGYLVPVDFKFDTYPSDYGIEETAFTAIDITNLEIGQITDRNGNHIDDFTNFQDHKRINEALKNFIEDNKLVEVR